MAGTKSRTPSPQIVSGWIKQGYGQSKGGVFRPFFNVRDVPSMGTSSMVLSRLTGRTHHYLSDLEFRAHLLAEYDLSTVDIREQYALLPWDEPQDIARLAGIRYPTYPTTKTPIVMTTDIVVTRLVGPCLKLFAFSVKPSKELTARDLEKLWIEQAYWKARGIPWTLLQDGTQGSLPRVRALNLKFFELARNGRLLQDPPIAPENFSRVFESLWKQGMSYGVLLTEASRAANVDANTAHVLMGRAVWSHQSRIDIDASLLGHRAPVSLRD